MVFTWNGREFQFITDVLGVAPLGASRGRRRVLPGGPRRGIQIPRGALAEVDGRYEVRITEELREVAYFDQIRLVAVDHPGEIEIFTERQVQGPPFPDFRLWGVEQPGAPALRPRPPGARRAGAGSCEKDRAYPDGFRRDHAGIAEMHHLDLDFGRRRARQPRGPRPLRLGGLGRRQHLPGRRRPSRPASSALPPGEGRRRPVAHRDRGHGYSRGQAEDHRGRPDRQVPLPLARGPHRHQPVRLLGRDLPERGGRRAFGVAGPRPCAFGGRAALPRLLAR
jgi:hypothetical protein